MPCPYPVALVDVSACRPAGCPSDCDPQEDCVAVAISTKEAAGSPYMAYNLHGGDLDQWLFRELTEWNTDGSAIHCMGSYVIALSETEKAILISDDLGATRVEIDSTDVTDWVAFPPVQVDGVDQTFLVICGVGGYIYGSYDGGRSWDTLSAGLATINRLTRIMIARQNHRVIYAIGENGTVVKTMNGGFTWYDLVGPLDLYALDTLTALWVASPNRVLVGTDTGFIYQTEDGGENWSVQAPLDGMPVQSIIKDIVGCGCGGLFTITEHEVAANHLIWRNVDGGASGRWYLPEAVKGGLYKLPSQVPEAVACCDINRAIVVGGNTQEALPTIGVIDLLAAAA